MSWRSPVRRRKRQQRQPAGADQHLHRTAGIANLGSVTVGQACSSIISNTAFTVSKTRRKSMPRPMSIPSAKPAEQRQRCQHGRRGGEPITYQQIYEANLKVISAGAEISIRCWKCAAKRERDNASNHQQTYVSMTQSFNNLSGDLAQWSSRWQPASRFCSRQMTRSRHANHPVKPPAVGD